MVFSLTRSRNCGSGLSLLKKSVEKESRLEFLRLYMLELRHGQYPHAKSIVNDDNNIFETEEKGWSSGGGGT